MELSYLDLLKAGKYVEACEFATDVYIQQPNEPNLRNRASTYLCLKQYDLALLDYLKVIEINSHKSDIDYINAGVC